MRTKNHIQEKIYNLFTKDKIGKQINYASLLLCMPEYYKKQKINRKSHILINLANNKNCDK